MPNDLCRASVTSLAMPSGRFSARVASTNCVMMRPTITQWNVFETEPQRSSVFRSVT